jgi:protein-tyrosine phosphatase
MIDLHCHYLPGVDDGPPDMGRALELAALAAASGITHAVLTPHVYPGVWDNTLESLRPATDAFREALAASGVPLQVSLGGEVRLLPECLERVDRDQLPTVGHWGERRVLLLEFPDGQIPVGAENAVSYLLKRGYVPLLAHPERNKAVMLDPRRLQALVEAGCLVQLTAASIIGAFGEKAQRTALQLLEAGLVTVIATDAHNVAYRPPRLAEARALVDTLYGPETADALTRTTPAKILGVQLAPVNPDANLAAATEPITR